MKENNSISDFSIVIRPSRTERIFLATADSVAQLDNPNLKSDLSLQIKLLILLGYEVVTAAPFVWQSEITRKAFEQHSALLEAQSLGLMGRPGISKATDYLTERQSDTKSVSLLSLPASSAFASEIPLSSAFGQARALDQIAPLIPRRGSVENYFENLVIKDVDYNSRAGSLSFQMRDGLPTKFSELGRRRFEKLSNEISVLPYKGHFSRAVIEATAVSNHVPQDLLNGINKRSTALYHVANALACDATLFTWKNYTEGLDDKIPYFHQFSLTPHNPYLFLRILGIFGVSPRIINELSIEKLQVLATSAPEVIAFVNWYKSFLVECLGSKGILDSNPSETTNLLNKISYARDAMIQNKKNLNKLESLDRIKIDWIIGGIGALISLKYGWGLTGYKASKVVRWPLDYLRKSCEQAMNNKLGDFEAMIIREGLRDIDPSSNEE